MFEFSRVIFGKVETKNTKQNKKQKNIVKTMNAFCGRIWSHASGVSSFRFWCLSLLMRGKAITPFFFLSFTQQNMCLHHNVSCVNTISTTQNQYFWFIFFFIAFVLQSQTMLHILCACLCINLQTKQIKWNEIKLIFSMERNVCHTPIFCKWIVKITTPEIN